MKPAFCRIDQCAKPAATTRFLGEELAHFCEEHQEAFEKSPEGRRARAAAGGEGPWRSILVHALWDFRIRVETEARRDADPHVIAARGGK